MCKSLENDSVTIHGPLVLSKSNFDSPLIFLSQYSHISHVKDNHLNHEIYVIHFYHLID